MQTQLAKETVIWEGTWLGQMRSGKYKHREQKKRKGSLCQSVFYKIRIYYIGQTAEPQREGEGRWVEGAQTCLEPLPTPSL